MKRIRRRKVTDKMVVEIGRLINEVQIETVKNNDGQENKVVNNTIAIYNGRGKTTYLDIVAWGGEAEFISLHFNKNDEIFVTGELQNRVFHKNNNVTTAVVLKVSSVKRVFGRRN